MSKNKPINEINHLVMDCARSIAVVLMSETPTYHGKIEIIIKNGAVVNVMKTESLDMR